MPEIPDGLYRIVSKSKDAIIIDAVTEDIQFPNVEKVFPSEEPVSVENNFRLGCENQHYFLYQYTVVVCLPNNHLLGRYES